ncbi:type IV pilin protein [Pseudoxanthomonas sp. PXM04]|uniref:type IV pilin protein n=1 Tax=Pseudoxanthomonas sp. PXM04 TaxID=2769297 RepID=UPI0017814131|nr:type IV pilin protein [Pseudoxanthomonas sp. PXM04]MBD9376151.1 type IV pilin protein [Pseudoxanthomonas sp. PXM04]
MKQRGFSLLELLIVLAITAILATIAYASYRDQVIKSRRSAGAACLQERAQYLERFYTTNMTYREAPLGECDAEVAQFYNIEPVGDFDDTSYAIEAVPTEEQPDPKCGTLTLNSRGEKGESGTGTVADCW